MYVIGVCRVIRARLSTDHLERGSVFCSQGSQRPDVRVASIEHVVDIVEKTESSVHLNALECEKNIQSTTVPFSWNCRGRVVWPTLCDVREK